jgi:hypothetical protein
LDHLPVRGTPAAAIGSVEAPDEATAIARAIEEFAIEPPHRCDEKRRDSGSKPLWL